MSPLEVLGAELGAIAARIDREASLRLDAALADLRRATAEMDLRFERLERAFADRVAGIKDGTSVTAADVAPMINEAVRSAVESAASEVRASMLTEIAARVAELPPAEDGKDADPGVVAETLRSALTPDIEAMVAEQIAQIEVPVAVVDHEAMAAAARQAVADLPAPRDGHDADPEQVARALAELITPNVEAMIAAHVAQVPLPEIDEDALAAAAERAVAAQPKPKDGADVDMDVVRALIIEEFAKVPVPKDGRTPTAEEIQLLVDNAVAALPAPAPGKDADMDAVRQFIREEVANIPAPKDGETPSDDRLREIAAPIIAEAVAALPPAEPGKDADPDEIRRMVQEAVSAIPVPKDGEPPAPEAIRAVVEEVVRVVIDEMPKPRDGEPGKSADPAEIRQMIEDAVRQIPPPKDGEPPSHDVIRAIVEDVARDVARDVIDAIPKPKDGEPGKSVDPNEVRAMVEEAVAAIPAPKDGETPSLEVIRAVVEQVVEEIPKPRDGEDGVSVDPEQIRAMVDEAVAAIPMPKDGKDGRLPIVKAWEDRVYYEGEVCSHDGATYQASVDTGRAPPHADWTCLAAKGRDGADADQIELCGTFDAERDYRRLSVVMLNGASFIAKRDNPGQCPGEGWQLMAQQGKRGGPGLVTKADRGTRPIKMTVNDEGLLHLEMDDGSSVECDLYPLLSRL